MPEVGAVFECRADALMCSKFSGEKCRLRESIMPVSAGKNFVCLMVISLSLVAMSCVPIGNVQFPEPSPGFQPKKEFNADYDKIWNAVKQVLDDNRIPIASSDKQEGRIST